MNKKYYLSLLIGFLFFHSVSHADESLSLSQVWGQINADSKAQEASRLETTSLKESATRASHHWLPRLYLDAKSYQTNDPGNSFFGILEQRSIQQSDFNPSLLNHPDSARFNRGALGLDLPLYEGGMRSTQEEMQKIAVHAQEKTTSQIQVEQFSQVSMAYSSIGLLKQQIEKLTQLRKEIETLQKNYHLGSKSNPIGYSGLLGMKSISNRLIALNTQYETQLKTLQRILQELGLKNEQWIPIYKDATTFVDQYNSTLQTTKTQSESSYHIQSMKENSKAAEAFTDIEKSRFLPRVGAFAESYTFSGARDTANGYTAGVYLQWNLFNPNDYGTVNESKLKAKAAQKQIEATIQQENTEKMMYQDSLTALKSSVHILNENETILAEQAQVTRNLFKSGSLNVLQYLEVLNHQTDLLAQQTDAELNLLKTHSQLLTHTPLNIDELLKNSATTQVKE